MNLKSIGLLVIAATLSACQSLQDRPSSTPAVKTMSVNGTSLTYLEQGSGTTVVFVHPAFSDHRIWEPQRHAVASRYRFIAIDQRYFGTAPWSDNGSQFSQATHIANLAAFIRELKAGPVHLVGGSYGATIALSTAVNHPELVRSLFLNEPALLSIITDPSVRKAIAEDRKGFAAVSAAVKAGNTAEATKLFFEAANGLPGGFDALPPASRAMYLDNGRTIPLQLSAPAPTPITCAQLGQLKVQVTLTKGELTRSSFKVLAEATQRCIPASELITIQGGRHASPEQQPKAFNEALLAFLRRN